MSNDNDAPAALRKFSWPFAKLDTAVRRESASSEVTDPQDYYGALALAEDGFYPIGANGQWHGGIHFGRETGTRLEQKSGIRCIADGEVIAWKIDDTYPTVEYATCRTAKYSTGFVLVRHRLALPATPAGVDTSNAEQATGNAGAGDTDESTLLFYSLYIHLLDWQGYRQNPDTPRPPFWGQDVYAVRERAMDADRNLNPHIPEGGIGLNLRNAANVVVGFAPRGTQLRLGERRGTSGYYAVTEVVSGGIVPPGLTDFYAFRNEMTAVPVEPATKGSIVIPESPIKIAAGTLVGHLGEYKRYIDSGAMCSDDPRPLAQIDVFTTENIEAFVEASRARAAQLPESTKTLLVIDRGARLAVPTGTGRTPSAAQLAAARSAGGGPVAHCTRVLPIKTLTAITEHDGTRWWFVDVGTEGGETASGWVCERDHAHVRLASPWEWPGFEIVRIDDTRPDHFYARHAAQHGQATPDEQTALEQRGADVDIGPIFLKLYDAIDDSGERKLTCDEIRRALRKPWLAQALSHLIIEHESEWSGPMAKWDAVDELIPENRKKDWAKEKERIGSLLWWGDVKRHHGLPANEPLVAFNLHAVGLLGAHLHSPGITTYRIHQNGLIERFTPPRMPDDISPNAHYIYYNAQGKEYDFGIFEGVEATRWTRKNSLGTGRIHLMDASCLGANPARKFGFRFTGTGRRYLSQPALASLIGALMESGYDDVTSTGFSMPDGSPGVSASHINGENGDFRFLRTDHSLNTPTYLNTTAGVDALDEGRQNTFNNALYKFGWTTQLAWRYTKNGEQRLLSRTVHYAGHHHHLHVGGYVPNLVETNQ